jgi:hypothetical protein
MFTVAPKGRVKLAVFLETPALSWMQRIVTGRVAEEDAVENAVRRAVRIARMWAQGSTRPRNFSTSGMVTAKWKRREARTVKKYFPSTTKIPPPDL